MPGSPSSLAATDSSSSSRAFRVQLGPQAIPLRTSGSLAASGGTGFHRPAELVGKCLPQIKGQARALIFMGDVMEEGLESLFKRYLPGLRLRALQMVGDALDAERLLDGLYRYGVCHAKELVNHPNPRVLLHRAMSSLLERGYHWSYRIPPPQLMRVA